MMLLSMETMRTILLLTILGLMLLAAFYLRGRRLSMMAYIAWGMLLLLFPVVGPFIVILARPGSRSNP